MYTTPRSHHREKEKEKAGRSGEKVGGGRGWVRRSRHERVKGMCSGFRLSVRGRTTRSSWEIGRGVPRTLRTRWGIGGASRPILKSGGARRGEESQTCREHDANEGLDHGGQSSSRRQVSIP